ncbi:dockerin type I domain-containing protein [Mucisphaera sp.]|uniref:dockerin type I domain-containing protein n=1 Tax=Mucisphaera sp. TaxID=2913024 RepID=UPI003D0AD976
MHRTLALAATSLLITTAAQANVPGGPGDLSPHIDIGVFPSGQLAVTFDEIDIDEAIVIKTFTTFLPEGGSGFINLPFTRDQDIAFRTASPASADAGGFQTFAQFGIAHPQIAFEAVTLDPLFEAFAFGQDLLDQPGDQLVLNTPGNGLDFHPTYILRTNTQDFVGRVEGTFRFMPLTATDFLSPSSPFNITFVVGGDYDDDSRLTTADIDALSNAAAQPFDPDFDLNNDLAVNADDTLFWLNNLFLSSPGDANLDRQVDLIDLSILATNFGQSDTTWSQADFNADQTTDLIDLSILATNFGFSASPSQIPEPAALTAGILALSLIRRRG